jgi:hypothetical protein
MVWVYMGSRAKAPPLPAFEILDVPDDEVGVLLIQRDCNYLQALEGGIDTSHFGFLHAGHVDPDDLAEDDPIHHTVAIRTPDYHIGDTAWGTTYAGYRAAGPGRTSWRFGNFLFPFWTQVPNGELGHHLQVRGWVPLDDEHITRSSYQRHICFSRVPIGTAFRAATAGELLSRIGAGHVHCSKWWVIASGMNRVRKAYMCRSPLLRC